MRPRDEMLSTETLPRPRRRRRLPGQPEWDLARRAWNLAVDQRPALVALPADAGDVVAIVDVRPRARPQGRAAGHRPQRRARSPRSRTRCWSRRSGCAGSRSTSSAQTARVQAGTLWLEVTEASLAARPVPALGLLARRRRRRLHARRRPELARAQARARRQQRDRDRARHPRRAARARDRRRPRRAVLGAARRRRQLRHRHRDGVPPVPVRRGLRRHDAVAVRARRRGAARWRDWTRTAPEDVTTSMRIMHLPPLPELPRLPARPLGRRDRRRVRRRRRGRRRAIAALRALEPELDTWAMVPAVALSRIHMDPEEPMPSSARRRSSASSTTRRSRRSRPTSSRARR